MTACADVEKPLTSAKRNIEYIGESTTAGQAFRTSLVGEQVVRGLEASCPFCQCQRWATIYWNKGGKGARRLISDP